MSRSPVLVGGTGRSGTTIVARLLGSHPSYHMIPIEVRFLSSPGGLCDLIKGACTVEAFEENIRGRWWYRTVPNGDTRGLHKIMSEDHLDAAMEHFEPGTDRASVTAAARKLTSDLLDPLAEEVGAESWIEMTPANVLRGDELSSLIPDVRLVNSIRDGREVAASVTRMHWGPNDPFEALDWWRDRMIQATESCGSLGERLLVVQLEDLAARARSETIDRLFAFVGLETTLEVEKFVDQKLKQGRARQGRWRETIPLELHERFEEHYLSDLEVLEDAGVVVPV